VRVSARKGYASPRGKTQSELSKEKLDRQNASRNETSAAQTSGELREILNSPLQQSGLTLAVQAAPFRSKPKEASIALAIEVDGARLRFQPQQNNTTFHDDLEVSFFALDDKSKPHEGTVYNLNLTLRPEAYERVRSQGLRLNPRVALAPGRYQVRIGIRESGAGELGSVFYDLDVPNFASDQLSMSGVLLTSDRSQSALTAEADKTVPPMLLPGPATTRREFGNRDTLSLFAEIYDNLPPNDGHTLDVVTTLVSETGRDVFKSTQTLSGNTEDKSRDKSKLTSLSYATSVPLKDLPPGRYLLRLGATAMLRGAAVKSVARETLITVVPAGSGL